MAAGLSMPRISWQGPQAEEGSRCARLPVSAAGSVEREERWRCDPYPGRGSRQGRDQRRIWGTNREYAMLITIRNR
jgi:hypothetical protein